jgi:hypothetical protein
MSSTCQHPRQPAAAQLGSGPDGLPEDGLLGGRVLQHLDDLDVAAAGHGEDVVARAEPRVEAAIAELTPSASSRRPTAAARPSGPAAK